MDSVDEEKIHEWVCRTLGKGKDVHYEKDDKTLLALSKMKEMHEKAMEAAQQGIADCKKMTECYKAKAAKLEKVLSVANIAPAQLPRDLLDQVTDLAKAAATLECEDGSMETVEAKLKNEVEEVESLAAKAEQLSLEAAKFSSLLGQTRAEMKSSKAKQGQGQANPSKPGKLDLERVVRDLSKQQKKRRLRLAQLQKNAVKVSSSLEPPALVALGEELKKVRLEAEALDKEVKNMMGLPPSCYVHCQNRS